MDDLDDVIGLLNSNKQKSKGKATTSSFIPAPETMVQDLNQPSVAYNGS